MCAHFLKCFETVWIDFMHVNMHVNISLNCSVMKSRLYTLYYIPAPQSLVGNNKATVIPEAHLCTWLWFYSVSGGSYGSKLPDWTTRSTTLEVYSTTTASWSTESCAARVKGHCSVTAVIVVNASDVSVEVGVNVKNWFCHQLWCLHWNELNVGCVWNHSLVTHSPLPVYCTLNGEQ